MLKRGQNGLLSLKEQDRNNVRMAKILRLFSTVDEMPTRQLLRHFGAGDRRIIGWALSELLGTAQLIRLGRGVKGDPERIARGGRYPKQMLAPVVVTESVL